MANLSQIANVQIALQTAAVPSGNFGTPLIAGLATFPERVRDYPSMDAINQDNSLPAPIKLAAAGIFSQTPHPPLVKVGRVDVGSIVISVTAGHSVVSGDTYKVIIGGVSATSTGQTAAADVMTALASALNGAPTSPVTATVESDSLRLTYKTGQMAPPELDGPLYVEEYKEFAPWTSLGDALTKINMEDQAWYGLIVASRDEDAVKAAAAWTETHGNTEQPKIFATASGAAGIVDKSSTTDIAYFLKDKNYFRTIMTYDPDYLTEYKDAAWMGLMFSKPAGGATWALKRLGGVTTTRIGLTKQQAAWAKNANTFEPYAEGIVLTNPGKTAAGEWIDIITGRDWLANTIQRDQVQMMINRDKVPYTNPGIALHEATLRASLEAGKDQGVIAPDEFDSEGKIVPGYAINTPNAVEIADAVKASRKLTLTFRARVAGAIHLVEVNGALAYSL